MRHNVEIEKMMTDIVTNLTAMGGKPNHCLWRIYEELQAWKTSVQWEHPDIGADHMAEMATAILNQLKTLSDKALADEIAETLKHYTPQALNGYKQQSCN